MEINGKVYRNLEGQVGYLTEKWDDLQNQIDEVRADLVHYIIVEELPTEDIDTFAVYLVGPKGTAPNQYYEEWVYVKKADESWMWEKLGDTASVDLSGYLQKVETVTTYQQVYGKYTDGGQLMMNAAVGQVGNALVQRNASGQIYVPATPTEYDHAASKQYVDNNFVAKMTGTPAYPKAYVLLPNGDQGSIEVNANATADTIVRRTGGSQINVPYTPTAATNATSKDYVDSTCLAKRTSVTTYPQAYYKKADGTQDTYNMSYNAVDGTIMLRSANGQVMLPDQIQYVPSTDQAVSKRYVDAVVGQLLYLHDLEIIITVDATNKLYVKAYLINDDPTAFTSFNRILYKRIDVQWGAYGQFITTAEPCSVSKLPDCFRQDEFDEPFIGFLYQYIDNGNLISGKTDAGMTTTTITDTVISW